MPGARDHRLVMTSRIVVVGASIGGLTTAETLRQEGFDGEIVLIGDEPHHPYTRPPLSKQILAGEWEPADAAIRSAAELDDLAIELRTSCTARGLDLASRTLRTSTGDVAFDELVIATGTEPRRHPLVPAALTLRTVDDALVLRERLRAARSVVVVGAGILGSEIASAARKHDVRTLVLGRSGTLTFGGVGSLLADRLAALHAEHGVDLALSADIVAADDSGLTLADGTVHTADLIVSMIGGTPRTRWLSSSGLDVRDGVACDSEGRAAQGVSAVGDVAAWADPYTGRPVRVEHQSNAVEQAVAVALRLVHGEPASQPVPLFWSELHGTRINAYGWFDPEIPLVPFDNPNVLVSRDGDRVHGAVGWGATPRDFRPARAAVATPLVHH